MKFYKVIPSLFRSKRELKTLLKATATSQIGAWADFIVSLNLFEFTPLGPLYSKALGATTGGIVNCFLNYQWTFRGNEVSKRMVALKYSLVWMGSMLLNSYGTEALYTALFNWQWLLDYGIKDGECFMFAQMIVSFLVSVFWNLLLQRYFVFQDLDIRGFINKHNRLSKK